MFVSIYCESVFLIIHKLNIRKKTGSLTLTCIFMKIACPLVFLTPHSNVSKITRRLTKNGYDEKIRDQILRN
jgi:hypothetical protein